MRYVLNPKMDSDPPDRIRRRLLSLTVMAVALACTPRRAWAQEPEPGSFGRTMRLVRNWGDRVNREPDEGDREAMDVTRFVSPVRPAPRSWSDGGITVS